MADDLREYSGWLQTSVSPTARKQLSQLAKAAGIELDVADGYIELEYQGRDANRFVLAFLSKVAQIVGDAEGEIRCEIETEEGDPIFEFYRIEGGRLARQRGRIVRETQEIVR